MEKSPKPVASIPPFGLRMQPALKSELDESAKRNARSLNAEIVARLEESLRGNVATGPDSKLIVSAIKRLEGLLASTEAKLSIADQRFLLLANAMAAAYPVVAFAMDSNPQIRADLERTILSGIRVMKQFVDAYEPHGYDAMASYYSTMPKLFPEMSLNMPSPESYSKESKSAKDSERRIIDQIKAVIDAASI